MLWQLIPQLEAFLGRSQSTQTKPAGLTWLPHLWVTVFGETQFQYLKNVMLASYPVLLVATGNPGLVIVSNL